MKISSFSVTFSTPPPVVSYDEVFKFESMSITLQNASEKKIYFEAEVLSNPKAHVEVHPSIGELGKVKYTLNLMN